MHNKMRKVLPVVCALVVAVIVPTTAAAQRLTGSITGVIKDTNDLPVPGVTVEVTSPSLIGGPQTVVTDGNGAYRFTALTPGVYQLAASITGFQTHRREGLTITLGGTVTYDVSLVVGGLEEAITVVGGVPLVDVTSSAAATNLNMEQLEGIPLGRNSWLDALATAPGIALTRPYAAVSGGTQGANNIIAFGSDQYANAFRIDGVDASDSDTGGARIQPVPGIFSELQVIGIGAQAEYGPFLGAVTNVVTKSGGNLASGETLFLLQTDALTAENAGARSFYRNKYQDWASHVGGPIVQNRLWFFGAYQFLRDSSSVFGGDRSLPSLSETDRYFAKVTWAPTSRQEVMFSFHNEINTLGSPLRPGQAPETLTVRDRTYPTPSLQWRWSTGTNTFVQAGYAGWYMKDRNVPVSGDLITPSVADDARGTLSGNATGWYDWDLSRTQLKADVSHFIDRAAGRHDLKFGFQFNRGYSNAMVGAPGGVRYTLNNGVPSLARYQLPHWFGGVGKNYAAFVDDAWQVGSRMTINVGVRFDRQQSDILGADVLDAGANPTGQRIEGIKNAAVWTDLSPRIGVVYQLTSDRRTVLKLNYGRYVDSLRQSHVIGVAPTVAPTYVRGYDNATGQYDILLQTIAPLTSLSLDPDLTSPKTDQYAVSIERQLGELVAVTATGVYKDTFDIPAFWNTTARYEPQPFFDSYGNQTITVYNQTNPGQDHYQGTNPSLYKQRYRGLVLSLTKRSSQGWHATTSLTLSRSEGIGAVSRVGQGNTLLPSNANFRDVNSLVNNEGPLQGDRPVMFKLLGGYNFPGGVRVAANYTHQSGTPYARTVRLDTVRQTPLFILAEPRGALRFPSQDLVDVRAEKTFRLGGRVQGDVFVDVFNMLNRDTTLDVLSTVGTASTFLQPSAILDPRVAQIGFGLRF